MIKSLSGGPGVTVNNGGTPYAYVYVNMSVPSAGMMRFNGSTSNIEVYDGSVWLTMPTNNTTVELDSDTLSLLEWARKKKIEEMERDMLAVTNPAIKDLIRQIEEKEKQILVIQTLIREEDKVGTN